MSNTVRYKHEDMIDMFGEVEVGLGVVGLYGENWGWRGEGVDAALERQIFITLRIGSNDDDSKNNAVCL